jgi:catalase
MAAPVPDPVNPVAKELLQALDDISGVHPGFRPAHAKGVMLTGEFTPSAEAASLSRAPHLKASTPVTVRFSDSTGMPNVADNDPQFAGPRGIAIRFHLAEHVHTDIIAHSTDGFPTRTGEEFAEMLRAVKASANGASRPTPIEQFLGTHPAALRFVTAPKPIPSSFSRESYFGVTAMKFLNTEGAVRFGRYRIGPEGGADPLDPAAAAAKGPNFLMEEIVERVGKGPVRLQVRVQLAEAGDVVDDATVRWPEDRKELELGAITLTAAAADDNPHKRIIFDPLPRVDGIESSGDPLLDVRADVYLMSGRRRRASGGY